MPVHHRLLEHLAAYLAALGPQEIKSPLFRAALGRTGKLGPDRLSRHDAYAMVRRRAIKAGVVEKIGNHSFRGTGITTYLENDGTLELAQEMANHASPRTTKLYDRRGDNITRTPSSGFALSSGISHRAGQGSIPGASRTHPVHAPSAGQQSTIV
jgi:integrase